MCYNAVKVGIDLPLLVIETMLSALKLSCTFLRKLNMKKLLVALLSAAFVTSAFAVEASAPEVKKEAVVNNSMMAKTEASSAKHSKKHSKNCLLYTSDAADE